MQITYNQSELENIVTIHALDSIANANPDDINSVVFNENGTVTVIIGEEHHEDETPPVVDKPKRTRGPNKRNPAEAKHVPVEAKKELEQPAETQTSTGGQNESSTQEAKEAEQGEQTEPTEQLKEEATEQAEEAASEEASQEAEVKQEVQEEKAAEALAAKPSLFANLKR